MFRIECLKSIAMEIPVQKMDTMASIKPVKDIITS